MKFQVFFPDKNNVIRTDKTPDMTLDTFEQVKKMTEIVPQPYIVIPTREKTNIKLWGLNY